MSRPVRVPDETVRAVYEQTRSVLVTAEQIGLSKRQTEIRLNQLGFDLSRYGDQTCRRCGRRLYRVNQTGACRACQNSRRNRRCAG